MRKLIFGLLLPFLLSASASAADLKTVVEQESKALLIDQFGASVSTAKDTIQILDIPWNQPGVQFWLQYYKNRMNRLKLVQQAARYSIFLPYVKPILKEEGVPEVLAYLPIIESEGNPAAVSRAGAAGLWQLMPRTARLYGLRVNYYIDERFDIEKSTRAAARYLKKLYKIFGKWDLAIAAYNAGPGKILSLMRRYHTDSFWDLAKLPDETLNYVPKFYAVASLINSGQIKVATSEHKLLKIKIVSKTSLYAIARKLRVKYSIIKNFNRQYRKGVVPAYRYVYVPAFSIGNRTFLAKAKDARIYIYRPYRTEKVTRIARKFGTDVHTVEKLNRIRGKYVYRGQVLIIVAYNNEGKSVVMR
ncbi:lytic transglycosylase domain-containing protein [Desulfurobacterium sp.]|uniref:lytic transglycosylase domain-containing protein n=1 Tax=Desulfurobacterium sp. TaxID=2004706 RepID=UPI002617E740|nr:lytic transglycosylase domain-containing protein [Desulfurobacterium sp.]